MDLALNKRYIAGFSLLSVLFLMLTFQAQFYSLKIILLFLAFMCNDRVICISSPVIKYVICLVLYGLWGLLIGMIHLNENPFLGVTTTVIWPLLFLFFVDFARNEDAFYAIVKVIFIAHCFVVIYDILYAYSVIIGFPFPQIYNVEEGFTFYGTTSRLNLVNLNTLTFTTPFLAMLILSGYHLKIPRIIQFFILILTFFLFVLSGRRSVMAQLLLIPLLVPFFGNSFSKDVKQNIFRLLLLLLILILLVISYIYFIYFELFEGYIDTFIKAFDSSQEPVKFLQHQSLISSFMEKPLTGYGFGAYFYDPGRATYMNQMELQYQLSLAQTGIIGFLLFMTAHWGLCRYSFKLSVHLGDKFLLANSFGYLFMLLSHATNPVLCSFDLMVSYFLILIRINFIQTNINVK